MEKINIAELLKDCPKGMELYSPIFGDVYLDEIRPHLAVVIRTSANQKEEFLYDGRFGINGECMLFPSKENRDWNTFQRPFKDGDVLAYYCMGYINPSIYIYKYSERFNTEFYVALSGNGHFKVRDKHGKALFGNSPNARFATEEEKQKLFDVIKANGYKWNPETKILKKLIVPKFKVKDKIKNKINKVIYTIKAVGKNIYTVEESKGKFSYYISFNEEENYELVPNKFDITTLKPFESKVLVRSSMDGLWKPAVFGFRNGYNDNAFYIVGGSCWKQCIPYLNNEHLCGTTNDCDDYYKTWK